MSVRCVRDVKCDRRLPRVDTLGRIARALGLASLLHSTLEPASRSSGADV
ncbi:hypothetical protein [Nonomuraea sp. LPB2021202275-12-8]